MTAPNAVLMAAALAVGLGWLYAGLRPRVLRLAPARRARLLLLLAALPAGLGALHAAVCLASVACFFHRHGALPALCELHPASAASWILTGLLLVALGGPLVRTLRREGTSRRRLRQLSGSARLVEGARLVESDAPFAAATDREILLSSGLLRHISPTLMPAVVAHERAHVRRRDPTRMRWAMRLTTLWLPRARRVLLADLELACEQACDEHAAEVVGDRVLVAQALLAVERLLGHPVALQPAAQPFHGGCFVARVEALLDPPRPAGSLWAEGWQALSVLALALALTDPLHHLTEALVAALGLV